MTREPTASLLSGNVEYSNEIKNPLIIEGDATTKNNKSIEHIKDYSVFLLNHVKSTFHDKPMEKYTEKRKYKQSVSECNKWRSLIKTVVGRNITVLKNKYIIYFPV